MAFLKSSQVGLGPKDIEARSFTQASTINLGDRTYTEHEILLADNYNIVGDVTVSDNLILSKLSDDGNAITITGDSTTRTISGSGSIEGSTLAQTPNSDMSGMTGTLGAGVTLGSAVTGSPALNLSNATKVPSGSVIRCVTSDVNEKNGLPGWVGNQSFAWGTYTTKLTFTNPGAGNKLVFWGQDNGYLGEADRAVYYTWFVKDNVNVSGSNGVNVYQLNESLGGMGGNQDGSTRSWMTAFYINSSAQDWGNGGGLVMGWYTVPKTISGNVEVRLCLYVTNTGNTYNSWSSHSYGFELQG